MRKTTIGTAALAAAVIGSALPAGVTSAHADHPNTVCSHWAPEGDATHHVQVDWMAGRSFRVSITDFTLRAAEQEAGDSFIPLPLDPNLRLGTNTVSVGEGLSVSDVSLSQAVALGAGGRDSHQTGEIESYLKLASAPWESATVTGDSIEWLHDLDARSDGDGAQHRPSETPTVDARRADSAGVLDFTVTVPGELGGEVALVRGMTSAFTAAVLSDAEGSWAPGQPQASTIPGCTVSMEPVASPVQEGGGEPVPDPAPETDSDDDKQELRPSQTPGNGATQRPGAKPPAAGEEPHDPKAPNEPTLPEHDAPDAPVPDRPEASSPDGGPAPGSETPNQGQDVARSGGFNATPWIVGAGGAAALGVALAVAARRSSRAKRGHSGS